MKYTKQNNILLATIAFMNKANYEKAFQGLPVVIKGFTGQQVKEKRIKLKNGEKIKTKLFKKESSNNKPIEGMRYPEKRRGRRKEKAIKQMDAQLELAHSKVKGN